MKASAECSSLEAACADLEAVADSNTVRAYLNQALPVKELREQERQVNRALADCIPTRLERFVRRPRGAMSRSHRERSRGR